MTDKALLSLYDSEVRAWIGQLSPGYVTELAGQVVRLIGPGEQAHDNAVLWTGLDSANADAAIAEQTAFFGSQGRAFEWKHFSHDEPFDLGARLQAAGFVPDDAETLVAFDVAQDPGDRPLPAGIRIERLDDPAACADIATVNGAVYGDSESAAWLAETIAQEKRAAPDSLSIYAAYANDEPISVGWMRHKRGDTFGGLFGGSTLAEWRGKGVYSALVAARAREALARGCRWLTVDCSPMSLPILERRGFRRLSVITPFIWSPPAS
ncbi:GNAT family N-acetyltransferase [Microvirga terricola]|uniref:GNAT family N-acetyltransferase n=1 Tax=Microvirga terricola TaxID=2719797 RepID=A0ABX0VA14_9HYPH|nr:GNAT family N-acetyltransferase [Microvirga terricola]NIX76492.1 GNAT family N-acetyltransferase [Microvirga terricola]